LSICILFHCGFPNSESKNMVGQFFACASDGDETYLLARSFDTIPTNVRKVAESPPVGGDGLDLKTELATTMMPLLPLIAVPLLALIVMFICWRSKKHPEGTSLRGLASRGGSVQSSAAPSEVALERPECTSLCAELVVPPHGECVFALPVLQMPVCDEMVVRDVTDKNGEPLLHLALTRIPGDEAKPTQSEYVMLGKTDDSELAFCELELGQGDRRCSIFSLSGDLFAHLEEEWNFPVAAGERSFVVSGAAPMRWKLRFHGDFVGRKVQGINVATGRPVALISPGSDLSHRSHGENYKVRLGPLADSGLVIVSLVVIDRILRISPRSSIVNSCTTDSRKG